jgi:hypothetical protein
MPDAPSGARIRLRENRFRRSGEDIHYDDAAGVSILASRVQLTHRSRCLELSGLSGAIDPWGESTCRARLGLCARALNSPNLRNADDQPENRR